MKRLLFFILSLLLPLVSPHTISAQALLWDNFDDGNTHDNTPMSWTEFASNGGGWWIQNGEYVGTTVKNCGPDTFSYSLTDNPQLTDYAVSVKIMGTQGVDKKIMVRYQSNGTRYDINLIRNDGIYLQKWVNYSSVGLWRTGINNINNQWYLLKVEAVGKNIKVFIDNQKYIDINDENHPLLSGDVGLQVWPGFYNGCGSVTVTRFDDFVVTELTPPNSIILLPGLGASWNYEAMILDANKSPEEWFMTPGVKVYDGLIQTLQNAGYTINQNLFVFNYDWRKPVEGIANDLKDYIGRHPPPAGTKINLIGHSLGGLVARTYIQENPNNQIDKLITIGSPHKGAVKSYYVWEGADLAKGLTGWQRIGAGILVQLKKRGFENNVETIRHIIPGLKDLLPTFTYLKKGGSEKPLSEMQQRNTWLESLNTPPLPVLLTSKSNTIVGLKGDTLRWINTQSRDPFDQLLGKWVDGKPTTDEFAIGDNTVLSESARLPEATIVELQNTGHSELVETTAGQQAIVNLLGLSPSSIVAAPQVDYIPALVFQMASPAKITVFNPTNQKVAENEKLVVVTNPQTGSYKVVVSPEGAGGSYRLLVGKLTQNGDLWNETAGIINAGQIQEYYFTFNPTLKTNKGDLLTLSKNRLTAAQAKANVLNGPVNSILSRLIQFRIQEVGKIITHHNSNMTKIVQDEIKQAVTGITALQDNIKQQVTFQSVPADKKNEILNLIKEARDYLIQAYELK